MNLLRVLLQGERRVVLSLGVGPYEFKVENCRQSCVDQAVVENNTKLCSLGDLNFPSFLAANLGGKLWVLSVCSPPQKEGDGSCWSHLPQAGGAAEVSAPSLVPFVLFLVLF